MVHCYPMTFTPVLKDYLWGGRNLERLGRTLPPDGMVAESWEIAAHEDGVTLVDNGPYAGWPLTQVQAALGIDLVGRANAWAQARGKFPLLIKLLDANAALSVQVHPDDAYALTHEGNELGKTEMWVVLDAQPDAAVILGVTPGVTPEAFRRGIEQGQLDPLLNRVPVKAGDHICVPAGSLHAILGGQLIAEIQQNSNSTYRVYDWNRLDASGKPRPLHVDKALAVANFGQVAPGLKPARLVSAAGGVARWELCRNRYFVTERVTIAAGSTFEGDCTGDTLEIWGLVSGRAAVAGLALEPVRFCLLPAALGPFAVAANATGGATLLRTYVADSDITTNEDSE